MSEILYHRDSLTPIVCNGTQRAQSRWTLPEIHARGRYRANVSELNVTCLPTTHPWTGSRSAARSYDPPVPVSRNLFHRTEAEAEVARARNYGDPTALPEPQWLGQARFYPLDHYTVRRTVSDPYANDDTFENDDADSDLECDFFLENERAHRTDFDQIGQGEVLEEFYNDVSMWIIDTRDSERYGHIFSNDINNAAWVRWFISRDSGAALKEDVTRVLNLEHYRSHLLAFHMLNIRSNVRSFLESARSSGIYRSSHVNLSGARKLKTMKPPSTPSP